MFVNPILLVSNPFYQAYIQSDLLGKLIFLSLIFLSILSWIIILYKGWLTYQARFYAKDFDRQFQENKQNPLAIEYAETNRFNPFGKLYLVLKKNTAEILNKNRLFGKPKEEHSPSSTYLSPSDIDIVQSYLQSTIASQTKQLEKNLFLLATVYSLGPFLGLLGTVWGILATFGELQAHSGGNTSQMVLGGLSLALATTVLGLIDAIPALIGYNYLKSRTRDFETDMEGFATEMLAAVEMRYRKVDVE